MPESSAPFGNSNDDPLSTLNVFDRLEVGPVKLERRRLVAPYRLFHGDQAEQTELIYTLTKRMCSIPRGPNPGTWPT
jgi:hypothetical protein